MDRISLFILKNQDLDYFRMNGNQVSYKSDELNT